MTEQQKMQDPSADWTRWQRAMDDYEADRQITPRGFEFGVTGEGRPAWHGETIVHDGVLYADDVLERYGFDDPVVKRPLFVPLEWDDGNEDVPEGGIVTAKKMMELPDKYATVRSSDGKPLGVVGSRYTVVQNKQAFAWMNTLVEADRLEIVACVSLKGGRIVAITAKLPDDVLIAGETIIPYLNFINGFDGKTPISVLASPVRQVCMNTVELSFDEARAKYAMKHTSRALEKLQDARLAMQISFRPGDIDDELAGLLREEAEKALAVTTKYTGKLVEEGEKMASRKFSNLAFDGFLKKLVPVPEQKMSSSEDGKVRISNAAAITQAINKQLEIRTVYMQSDNLGNIRGTEWGALQAVVEWNDHVKSWKNEDRKVESILAGDNETNRAYAILKNS